MTQDEFKRSYRALIREAEDRLLTLPEDVTGATLEACTKTGSRHVIGRIQFVNLERFEVHALHTADADGLKTDGKSAPDAITYSEIDGLSYAPVWEG